MDNNASTPLSLWQFLAKVDPQRNIYNYGEKHLHKVQYNNSRSIIRYLREETRLIAYACNPGNGLIMLAKKGGIMAYAVIYLGYPNANGERVFLWSAVRNLSALRLIRDGRWEHRHISEGIDYNKGEDTHIWPVIDRGVVHYVSSSQGDQLISKVQPCAGDLVIMRLSSGKLRLELDDNFCSCQTIGKAMNYFEHPPLSKSLRVFDLPRLNGWSRIVSIDPLPEEISARIKAQAIADTINDHNS